MSRPISLFNLALQQQRDHAAARGACAGAAGDGGATPSSAVLALLGKNGKSADTEPGKAAIREREGKSGNLLSSRGRRYRMQRTAQQLLPDESVSGCHRFISNANWSGEVLVVQRPEGGTSYRGVQTCGSVWHCPVCANKIAEQRRAELFAGMATHRAQGGRCYMLTLTFPHRIDQDLAECLEGLRKALKTFKASRQWRTVRERIGFKGTVRALEVTHGENGWHPHTHELVFANGDEESVLAELESLRDYWAKAVHKAGLGQISIHGFQVGGADKAASYVTKYGDTDPADDSRWDASREMTRQHSKLGRRKGRTPFALLHDAMIGDGEAKLLFQEYAREFKGARQLYYTPGLRAYLGLDDISDEQLAAADQDDAPGDEPQRVLWHCTRDEWKLLLLTNMRGEFLDIAAKHGTDGCFLFLKALRLRQAGRDVTPTFINPEIQP